MFIFTVFLISVLSEFNQIHLKILGANTTTATDANIETRVEALTIATSPTAAHLTTDTAPSDIITALGNSKATTISPEMIEIAATLIEPSVGELLYLEHSYEKGNPELFTFIPSVHSMVRTHVVTAAPYRASPMYVTFNASVDSLLKPVKYTIYRDEVHLYTDFTGDIISDGTVVLDGRTTVIGKLVTYRSRVETYCKLNGSIYGDFVTIYGDMEGTVRAVNFFCVVGTFNGNVTSGGDVSLTGTFNGNVLLSGKLIKEGTKTAKVVKKDVVVMSPDFEKHSSILKEHSEKVKAAIQR